MSDVDERSAEKCEDVGVEEIVENVENGFEGCEDDESLNDEAKTESK